MILTKFSKYNETHDVIACVRIIQMREQFHSEHNRYPSKWVFILKNQIFDQKMVEQEFMGVIYAVKFVSLNLKKNFLILMRHGKLKKKQYGIISAKHFNMLASD